MHPRIELITQVMVTVVCLRDKCRKLMARASTYGSVNATIFRRTFAITKHRLNATITGATALKIVHAIFFS